MASKQKLLQITPLYCFLLAKLPFYEVIICPKILHVCPFLWIIEEFPIHKYLNDLHSGQRLCQYTIAHKTVNNNVTFLKIQLEPLVPELVSFKMKWNYFIHFINFISHFFKIWWKHKYWITNLFSVNLHITKIFTNSCE